jgi:uracil-DNA glycosylase
VTRLTLLERHQAALRACTRCEAMHKPVVVPPPIMSRLLLVGQAPGDKEPRLGRPFAWTAGKNLFKWLATIGVDEDTFRRRAYMAAVCRCFPGKNPKGGDRVPSEVEIANCAPWLEGEIALLKPTLIVPVGKLAIARFLPDAPLTETIGRKFSWRWQRRSIDVVPLPHPSGASTWYHTDPGKSLTQKALALIAAHPAWAEVARGSASTKRSP